MLGGTLFWLSVVLLVTAQSSTSNTLLGVLSSNGLSGFQNYIGQYPALQQQLEQGNVTVLAPSNAAIANYLSSGDATASNFSTDLQTLLEYHVIQGHYTRALLKQTPLFLPTLALDNNTAAVNVTGGQRIEVSSFGQRTVFQSGLKRNSTLVTADMLYQGSSTSASVAGVIHVIDRVLTLPVDQITTAQRTGLSNFVSLVATLPRDPQYLGFHDGTIFAPNGSVPVSSNYSADTLYSIESYHLVKGIVYSPDLTDGRSLATRLLGPNLTITVQDGDTYVNDAKILATDYLISMGVMHILDRPLNPQNPDARPPPPGWRTHLPTGAYIGMGVGVALVVIAIVALLWHFFRRRKRKEEHNPWERTQSVPDSQIPELPGTAKQLAELHSQSAVYYELDHDQASGKTKDKTKIKHAGHHHEIFELG